MRIVRAAVVTCVVSAVTSIASAEYIPARKPGLWRIENQADKGATVSLQVCIGAGSDDLLQQPAAGSGANCAKMSAEKMGNIWLLETNCTLQKTKVVSKTTLSGDLNSAYAAAGEVTYDPPLNGMSKTKVKVSGTWMGPCGPGMAPGDVILPDGSKANPSKVGAH